jgi:hypothetical protein
MRGEEKRMGDVKNGEKGGGGRIDESSERKIKVRRKTYGKKRKAK